MRTHTHTRIFSHIRYLHVFRQHPLCGSKEETEKLQMKQAPSLPVLKAAIDRFAHETGGAGIDGEGKTESEGGERRKRASARVCGKCVLTQDEWGEQGQFDNGVCLQRECMQSCIHAAKQNGETQVLAFTGPAHAACDGRFEDQRTAHVDCVRQV